VNLKAPFMEPEGPFRQQLFEKCKSSICSQRSCSGSGTLPAFTRDGEVVLWCRVAPPSNPQYFTMLGREKEKEQVLCETLP
jgi:hypothetical protein